MKSLLSGHDVSHARDVGWRNLENGKLLAAAAGAGFAVLVTIDKNMRHQQNLEELPLAVVEIDLVRSRLQDIRAVSQSLLAAVEHTVKFRFVSVKGDGSLETLSPRPA